jgi:hypothetical protein
MRKKTFQSLTLGRSLNRKLRVRQQHAKGFRWLSAYLPHLEQDSKQLFTCQQKSRHHDTKLDMNDHRGAESLPYPLHDLHTPLSQCGVAGHVFIAVNSDRHTGACSSKDFFIVG